VLTRFEHALQIDETAVTLHKIAVHFRRNLSGFEEARAVEWTNLAIRGKPTESVRVDLIARNISGANLLDDAVPLQRKK